MAALEGLLTYFYVRVPEDQNPEWRIRHADGTVHVAGGFIMPCDDGVYTPQPDGTYEVRALSPSNTDLVREMLTEHEGLIIEREDLHPRTIAAFFVEVQPD